MGNLTNKYVKDTYDGLLKLQDETSGVKATLQPIQDGLGNDLPIKVSSTEVVITGSFSGDGSNLTGITSTNAVSASHAIYAESALSASYAPDTTDTGSLVSSVSLVTPFNNQVQVGKGDGSSTQFTIDNVTSASYADLSLTASYAENVDLPSGVVSGSQQIVDLGFATTSSLTSLSSSIASTDLGQDGRLNALETESGSIRGDFNTYTSSNDSKVNSLISGTGSYATTSSVTSLSSSIASTDLGQDNRLDSLEEKTGSYATTGSNVFVGLQQINNDLVIQGNLYVSGSEVIVSSSTLIVGDREIELNANRTIGNSGIIVYDVVSPEGTGSLQYDVTNNYWIAGQYGSESRIVTSDMTSSMSVASSVSSSHSETSDNAISSSHSLYSESSLSSSHALYAESSLSASHSETSDNAISSSHAIYAETAGSSQYSDNTVVTGKNMTGSEILKGTPLYFSGSGTAGNLVGVYPADAGDPDKMPAGGVAGENIASGAEGVVLIDGFINGVDTSLFAAGDEVYVAVGGGYTNVVPTGSANQIQKLGNVEKSDAINGSGVINGPGASRAVPNIQEGYIWVGNGDGVATPTSTGSFARRDEVNVFTQNQIITGSVNISGTTTIDGILNVPNDVINAKDILVNDPGAITNILVNSDYFTEFRGARLYRSETNNTAGLTMNEDNVLISMNGYDSGTGYTYDYETMFVQDSNGLTLKSRNYKSPPYPQIDVFNVKGEDKISFPNGMNITGSVNVSGSITGSLFGTASYATEALSASYAPMPDVSYFATTGSNVFVGNQTITGSVNISGNTISNGTITQNFTAPATEQEVAFANVSGASISGKTYNRVFFGMADYPGFGLPYEDYFTIEYWDSFGYNYGSEISINGKQTQLLTYASGSSKQSSIQTRDNYDGTSWARVTSQDKVEVLAPEIIIGLGTGSDILIEGSVQQWVSGITINSATASVDFSKSNFQTLTLAAGVATHIIPTNMSPGQSVVVEITQDGSSAGTVTMDSLITFPGGTDYVATTTLGGKDVLTLVSFDGTVARGAAQNDFS